MGVTDLLIGQLLLLNAQLTISTHHGSSVGSQQTRHTLQVKHMALSSPVEAGCGSQASKSMKTSSDKEKNKKLQPFSY